MCEAFSHQLHVTLLASLQKFMHDPDSRSNADDVQHNQSQNHGILCQPSDYITGCEARCLNRRLRRPSIIVVLRARRWLLGHHLDFASIWCVIFNTPVLDALARPLVRFAA
jgi:hypothetical protein